MTNVIDLNTTKERKDLVIRGCFIDQGINIIIDTLNGSEYIIYGLPFEFQFNKHELGNDLVWDGKPIKTLQEIYDLINNTKNFGFLDITISGNRVLTLQHKSKRSWE